jgi:hypothetical protein
MNPQQEVIPEDLPRLGVFCGRVTASGRPITQEGTPCARSSSFGKRGQVARFDGRGVYFFLLFSKYFVLLLNDFLKFTIFFIKH